MRCAKCGHEVDPDSPECPYCAAGVPPQSAECDGADERSADRCCPRCGSTDLEVIGRAYDPGCGCLGLLLFGWLGLLLGLPFAGERIVCRSCGAEWRRRGGCLPFLSVFLILAAVAAVGGMLEFWRGVFL